MVVNHDMFEGRPFRGSLDFLQMRMVLGMRTTIESLCQFTWILVRDGQRMINSFSSLDRSRMHVHIELS